jgi:hypothetical protein
MAVGQALVNLRERVLCLTFDMMIPFQDHQTIESKRIEQQFKIVPYKFLVSRAIPRITERRGAANFTDCLGGHQLRLCIPLISGHLPVINF